MTASSRPVTRARHPAARSDADLLATILLTAATLAVALCIAVVTFVGWAVAVSGDDAPSAALPAAVLLGGIVTGLVTMLGGTHWSLLRHRPAFHWPLFGIGIVVVSAVVAPACTGSMLG